MMRVARLLLAMVFSLSVIGLATVSAYAATANSDIKDVCASNPDSAFCAGYKEGGNSTGNPINDVIADVIEILYYVVGVLATFFIIWGGFKYVNSQGDSGKTANARNMIIYSIVGVIVAVIAGQLVLFILSKL